MCLGYMGLCTHDVSQMPNFMKFCQTVINSYFADFCHISLKGFVTKAFQGTKHIILTFMSKETFVLDDMLFFMVDPIKIVLLCVLLSRLIEKHSMWQENLIIVDVGRAIMSV